MIKTTLVGMIGLQRMSQMPLTHHCRLITRRLETLGHKMFLRMNADIHPRHDHAIGHPQAHGVTPGHQRGPGGRTDRRGIETRQLHTFRCQPVQRRGIDLPAMESDIAPAQVIGNHYDHIGAFSRCSQRGMQGYNQQYEVIDTAHHDSPSCRYRNAQCSTASTFVIRWYYYFLHLATATSGSPLIYQTTAPIDRERGSA